MGKGAGSWGGFPELGLQLRPSMKGKIELTGKDGESIPGRGQSKGERALERLFIVGRLQGGLVGQWGGGERQGQMGPSWTLS